MIKMTEDETVYVWNPAPISISCLNVVATMLSERQLRYLLRKEQRELKRPQIVVRLHQRLNTLRVKRERAALMERLTRTD